MNKKITNIFLKIIIIFLPILFFSYFSTPIASAAKLTVSDVTSNSATLNGSELDPNTTYVFQIIGPSIGTIYQEVTTFSTSQELEVPFINTLVALQSYTAILGKYTNSKSFSSITQSVTFMTKEASISFKNITKNSVVLNASGLIPTKQYKITLKSVEGDSEMLITTNINGEMEQSINTLKANTKYTVMMTVEDHTQQGFIIPAGTPVLFFETLDDITSSVSPGTQSLSPVGGNSQNNLDKTDTEDYKIGVDQAFLDKKSLVPCGNDRTPVVKDLNGNKIDGGEVKNKCTFDHIIIAINRLVNFVLFYLAIPLSAIMFAYAGFLFIFSAGNSGKREKAKGVFTNVVLGLIAAIAAWLVIHTILSILGYDGSWIGF